MADASRDARAPASRSVTSDRFAVGTRHLEAQVDEQLGDPTHATPADADEVRTPNFAEALALMRPHLAALPLVAPIAPVPDSSHTRSAMRAAASGRANVRIAALIRRCRSRSPATPPSRPPAVRRSARARRSPRRRRRARSPRRSCAGGRRLRSVSGTRIAGRPAAASSDKRRRPGAADTRSARFISRSISYMKASTRASRPARRYASRTSSTSRSPGLVCDRQASACGCQPRRCLHHGHVDRVRALRTAKNQTPVPRRAAASCHVIGLLLHR